MATSAASPLLLFVHLLSVCIWVGGFVAVVIVVRIVRRQLTDADQIVFFRSLGRDFGSVAGLALTVAIGTGASLLSNHGWDTTTQAAAALAAALVLATGVGVVQARGLTRLRHRITVEGDAQAALKLGTNAARGVVLRSAIGVITLALLAVGSVIAARIIQA